MTAAQLQKALDRAGKSQRGTAKEIGISERQMRRYCSGDAKVPRAVELAVLYVCSPASETLVDESCCPKCDSEICICGLGSPASG